MHSYISKRLLIEPIKFTIFILYIQLLYFSSMYRYHVHNHQGKLLCQLLKTMYCYIAVKYGFCSSYVINISTL